MIQKFVDKFVSGKETLEAQFKSKRPDSYIDIVRAVASVIGGEDSDDYGNSPDPERIHQIDDGDYQGTLVFVIGATGYQPSTYWYVRVSYGSCSGCDTLQAIQQWGDEVHDEEVKDYMTLALHIVQQMKQMDDNF